MNAEDLAYDSDELPQHRVAIPGEDPFYPDTPRLKRRRVGAPPTNPSPPLRKPRRLHYNGLTGRFEPLAGETEAA
jgi:hypothetical protein